MSSSVAGGAGGCGGAGGGSGGGGGGPCGACKFLRRKCASDCIFAPHFDQDQGAAQFAAVHRVFGASNVAKLLNYLPIDKRTEAVITICFEAQARLRDPVYGCVSHIFSLQQQIVNLQSELNYVQNHLAAMEQQQQVLSPAQPLIPMTGAFTELQPASNIQANVDKSYLLPTEQQQQYVHMGESSGGAGGSGGTDDLYELARGLLNRHGRVDGSEEPPQPKHQ